jgi:signal transduction histidine kinase/CheY-like chemotaxis protein
LLIRIAPPLGIAIAQPQDMPRPPRPAETFARTQASMLVGILAIAALGLVGATRGVAPVGATAAIFAGMILGASFGVAWSARDRRRSDAIGESSYPLDATPLTGVLKHCEDAIVFTDVSLRVWYANDAFVALCGRTMYAAAGTTIVDALAHRIADGDAFAESAAELGAHCEREATGELTRLTTPARTFEWRSMPLRSADGSVVGRGFLFHDRSQARELAGLKSDFLSTVTHELRTPLTSVKGSLQLVLGKSTALSPIDCELLHISLKNADRLIRLINDLLDISRLELGKIELTFAKVPTASLVDEAVAGLRAYAAGRQITIGCAVHAEVPAIEGDRDRLIQVLTNLISNAVKFSPSGGHVLVSAERQDDDVHIAVRDWGIGIPTADQSRLFQRFQRVNPGQSAEPGTGLGLAISKAIIERHGGRIVLDSREQAGSTFTIVVPAAKEALVSHGEADRPANDVPTVLLVDDDEDLATRMQEAWKDRYRILRIARGVEALDVARRLQPDVVLLDVVLPDLSGYDVLRILRTTAATAAIPVIMLTVQPERALAANLGAVDVIAKPFDLDHVTRAIDHALLDRSTTPPTAAAAGC